MRRGRQWADLRRVQRITLGEGDKRYHVKQLVFDASCLCGGTGTNNGQVNPEMILGYRFFLREQPYSMTETDTGLYTNIHDGLMDVRFSARSMRMRMEALTDDPWAVGKPRLEIRPGGRR